MDAHRLALRGFGVLVLFGTVEAQGRRFEELHRMVPSDVGFSRDAAHADVDADGDEDLVIANGFMQRNALLLNDGRGVFSDATTNLPDDTVGNSASVALADVDGDGDFDALFGNTALEMGLLYLNDGTGVFADGSAGLPGSSYQDSMTEVVFADVDGDGDPDVFVGNTHTEDRIYVNDGAGVFTDVPVALSARIDYTYGAAFGDLDADGDLDLFVANGNSSSNQNRIYLNSGAGFVDASGLHPTPNDDDTRDVALGDVDGDGDLDALLATGGQPSQLLRNDGTGTFSVAPLPTINGYNTSVELGDLDGDGDLDAALANETIAFHDLLLNDGTGAFVLRGLPPEEDNGNAVVMLDVDADLDLDLFLANEDQDRLYLNDGSGGFLLMRPSGLVADNDPSQDVALGDLDGDGDPDVFVGNAVKSVIASNRVYLNDGTGFLGEKPLSEDEDDVQGVELGDVDGDGDLDVMTANAGTRNSLYLNSGAADLTKHIEMMPVEFDESRDLRLGDADGDGDLDAFIANAEPLQKNQLYRNDGTGVFTFAVPGFPPVVAGTGSLDVGDIDGDGDLDVLACNGGADALFVNDGTGAFTDASGSLPFYATTSNEAALRDLDGDGDLDVVIAGTFTRLFHNLGGGAFQDLTGTLPVVVSANAVATADVDGDGDLDVLLGGGSMQHLLENDGTGHFSDASGELPPEQIGALSIAVSDMDDDGDLDFVTVSGGQNRLYTNVTRQVAWRGLPRVGKKVTIELYGSPFGTVFLGVSTGTAEIPYPPFGTLKLDPAGLSVLGPGVLDPDGFGFMNFPIPPDPALVGLSFYWQGLLGAPLRASNLEVTTATGL